MVQIEGMKMPKSCFECKFRYPKPKNTFGTYTITNCCFITNTDVYGHGKTRSQDCPLREVKK